MFWWQYLLLGLVVFVLSVTSIVYGMWVETRRHQERNRVLRKLAGGPRLVGKLKAETAIPIWRPVHVLASLEDDGLIAWEDAKSEMGLDSRAYYLTEQGALFAKALLFGDDLAYKRAAKEMVARWGRPNGV